MSDKLGGARVTFWVFLALVLTTFAATYTVPGQGGIGGNFWCFIITFELLFVFTGIGNGSVYRMIFVMFHEIVSKPRNPKDAAQVAATDKEASQESAAVIGFSSAFGAYGSFIWPRLFGTLLHDWGSVRGALWITLCVYVSGLAVAWWFCYRNAAEAPA